MEVFRIDIVFAGEVGDSDNYCESDPDTHVFFLYSFIFFDGGRLTCSVPDYLGDDGIPDNQDEECKDSEGICPEPYFKAVGIPKGNNRMGI